MTKYPVNDCYPCIQGEGVQTGVPMLLLRLHGCDVGCPWCDTKETWVMNPEHEVHAFQEALGTNERYVALSASEINYELRQRWPGLQWVLLTGGEPARYDLQPLIAALHDGGYKVALETSGTETGHLDAGIDWVCVSPKIGMPGGKVIQPEALSIVDEIKMVIGRPRDVDRLDHLLQTCTLKPSVQICLQPLSLSEKSTALCIQTVQNRNWRLSLQTQKFIDQR